MQLIVTAAAYPHGVMCEACKREILPGSPYKLRRHSDGKVDASTLDEKYMSLNSNYPVHADC